MDSKIARTITRLFLASLVVAALAQAKVTPSLAQGSYVVQDLGALPGDSSSVAWAINANGDVVGWSTGPTGTRAVVYTKLGSMVELPGLPNRPRTLARDINDAGIVVGSANAGGTDLGHAVLWSPASVQDLGTLGTGLYSEAWGVNNLGQVVGWSFTNGGSGLTGVHGFLYSKATGLVDLTPTSDNGYALDINDASQVTGYKTAFGGYHAFRWQEGTFVDLGVLPGFAHSFGWALNAAGQVTGNSTSASGNSERFVRSISGGGLQDLGGMGEHNVARGINVAGNVVGTQGQSQSRAVLYTDAAGLQDLNELIDPSLGWVLLSANDINDAEEIVGHAFNNFTGKTHAVKLRPAAGPPPQCSFRCMRSTAIVLRSEFQRWSSFTITGNVTIKDEKDALISGALVVAKWTYPDGSSRDANAWTDSNGVARFNTNAGRGIYTLTVTNVVMSQYTFNPAQSVMSKSINVRVD
jgi:probable HAF family extracellular repeat protein